jgi:inner membrane protein
MEPVTHFLFGACIGRAGLNRKTAYATLAAVLAAEAADMDVLWSLAGPVEELKHHRGITHTFVGAPVMAGVVIGVVWLLDRYVLQRRRRRLGLDPQDLKGRGFSRAISRPDSMPALAAEGIRMGRDAFPQGLKPRISAPSDGTAEAVPFQSSQTPASTKLFAANGTVGVPQAVHWGWLYLTALIAVLSHILLDWTNNYGVRPFFPFNPRWYAGSFVFIAEPVLWVLLAVALIFPGLLGLADREMGARRVDFRGRGWAIFALTSIVALWCWRWVEHAQALALVESQQLTTAPVKRIAIEPYPVNPFRWHAILETDGYYQTAEIDTRTEEVDSDPRADVIYKPAYTEAAEAAKRTPLGQVYLDWGSWAVVRDVGQVPVAGMDPPQLGPGRTWTTVEFDDLRFDYSYLGTGKATGPSPLAGWVYVVDGHDDAGEAMHGREQR